MYFSISTIAFKNYRPKILLPSIKQWINKTHSNLELWEKHLYLASDHEILNKVRSISIYENFSQPFFDGLEGIVDFKKKFITKDRLLVRVFAGNKSSHLMNASERMILFKNIDKYYSRYLKKNMILMFETHQGTFLDTPASILEFIKCMNNPEIKLLLDIHNLLTGSCNSLSFDFIKAIMPHIIELHIKNTLHQVTTTYIAPTITSPIRIPNIDIDKGFIPWLQYFSLFKKLNFNGNLVLEWFVNAPMDLLINQEKTMRLLYENAS